MLVLVGCAPEWQYAYDEGVRQSRREDRDLVVFYKDPLEVQSSRMRDVLQSPQVAPLIRNMVRCLLVPSYSPNRSFVAQYGVHEPLKEDVEGRAQRDQTLVNQPLRILLGFDLRGLLKPLRKFGVERPREG